MATQRILRDLVHNYRHGPDSHIVVAVLADALEEDGHPLSPAARYAAKNVRTDIELEEAGADFPDHPWFIYANWQSSAIHRICSLLDGMSYRRCRLRLAPMRDMMARLYKDGFMPDSMHNLISITPITIRDVKRAILAASRYDDNYDQVFVFHLISAMTQAGRDGLYRAYAAKIAGHGVVDMEPALDLSSLGGCHRRV